MNQNNDKVVLSKDDIINIIYLLIISPNIIKYGLLLHSDNNTNSDIGLIIMLMGTFIFIANGLSQYKQTDNKKTIIN
jgi:hypothetical protein